MAEIVDRRNRAISRKLGNAFSRAAAATKKGVVKSAKSVAKDLEPSYFTKKRKQLAATEAAEAREAIERAKLNAQSKAEAERKTRLEDERLAYLTQKTLLRIEEPRKRLARETRRILDNIAREERVKQSEEYHKAAIAADESVRTLANMWSS